MAPSNGNRKVTHQRVLQARGGLEQIVDHSRHACQLLLAKLLPKIESRPQSGFATGHLPLYAGFFTAERYS